MIDWLNVFYNSLWIFALALALATVSQASFQASVSKTRFRDELAAPGIQLSLNIAGVLFSAGLALTTEPIWQIILWIILAIMFAYQAVISFRERRNAPPTP